MSVCEKLKFSEKVILISDNSAYLARICLICNTSYWDFTNENNYLEHFLYDVINKTNALD